MSQNVKKEQHKAGEHFVFQTCTCWSSSCSRSMSAAGRAASAAAIKQAKENGIKISYLKDGVVVTT